MSLSEEKKKCSKCHSTRLVYFDEDTQEVKCDDGYKHFTITCEDEILLICRQCTSYHLICKQCNEYCQCIGIDVYDDHNQEDSVYFNESTGILLERAPSNVTYLNESDFRNDVCGPDGGLETRWYCTNCDKNYNLIDK